MASPTKAKIAGWIVSVIVALLLIGPSASGKFLEWEGKKEMMDHLGFSIDLIKKIGILEITLAILYLIPRTSFLGAILLTGYLGGATVTHLRIEEAFFMPIVIGVVMWIGLALRKPIIFSLAAGSNTD